MPFEALLVSRDVELVNAFRAALEASSIEVRISTTSADALSSINRHRYDAIVIDCDDLPDAGELLEQVRNGRSNRNAVVFTVVNGQTTNEDARRRGANFVLSKPLSGERVARSVKAAHGLVLRERRRYYRHPLNITGSIYLAEETISARLFNVSEGGIGVKLLNRRVSGELKFSFTLPESSISIEGRGAVSWAEASGKCGVKFLHLSISSRAELERWLNEEIVR